MWFRCGIAAALMLVHSASLPPRVGFHGGTAADLCSAKQLRTATVDATLNIRIAGRAAPNLSAITVITVPASWPGSGALTADPFSDAFREAIECFLPTYQTDYRRHPPTVSMANGKVTVNDRVDLSPDPFGRDDVSIGLWELHEDNRNVTLSMGNLPGDPAQALWTVKINTGGADPRSWTPQPSKDDGGNSLSWESISSPQAQALTVTLAWPALFTFDHRVSAWPAKLLPEAGWNLGLFLFYALALLLLRRIRRRAATDNTAWYFREASCITFLGLASVPVSILNQYEGDQPVSSWLDTTVRKIFAGGNFFSGFDAFANTDFLVLLLFSSALFYAAWRKSRLDMRLFLLTGTLTVLACLIQLFPAIWGGDGSPIFDYGRGRVTLQATPGSLAHAVVSTLPLLVTCYLLISAVIGYSLRLWPVDVRNQPRLKDRPLTTRCPYRWNLAALAVALAAVGMVAYSSYQDWNTDSILGNSYSVGPLNWVISDLLGSFYWLFQEIPGLLFWPVAAGLFGALWLQSQRDPRIFFGNRKPVIAVLGLIYAALFIGIWGEDFIFDIPIAFMAAYILLTRVAVSNRLENLDNKMWFEGNIVSAPAPVPGMRLKRLQFSLLKAAEARKRLETELAAMSSGPADADHGSTRNRQDAEREIQDSGKRWDLYEVPAAPDPGQWQRLRERFWRRPKAVSNLAMVAPHPLDPAQTALAVGPEPSWWGNGWRCMRIGAPLVAAPTAYYLYENWTSGQIWPVDYRMGLIDTLQLVIGIPVGWLSLCFVYGCIQPYLRGGSAPVRGATLGLVALISYTLDAIPTFALHGPHYSKFLIDGLIAMAFTAVLAVMMDAKVLNENGLKVNRLVDYYHMTTVRVSLAYALTIIVALIGIWQQAHVTNQLDQQRAQIGTSVVNNVRAQVTPPSPG